MLSESTIETDKNAEFRLIILSSAAQRQMVDQSAKYGRLGNSIGILLFFHCHLTLMQVIVWNTVINECLLNFIHLLKIIPKHSILVIMKKMKIPAVIAMPMYK